MFFQSAVSVIDKTDNYIEFKLVANVKICTLATNTVSIKWVMHETIWTVPLCSRLNEPYMPFSSATRDIKKRPFCEKVGVPKRRKGTIVA